MNSWLYSIIVEKKFLILKESLKIISKKGKRLFTKRNTGFALFCKNPFPFSRFPGHLYETGKSKS